VAAGLTKAFGLICPAETARMGDDFRATSPYDRFGSNTGHATETSVRLTPRDTAFYDLFTASAENLVTAVTILAKSLAEGADRADLAAQMKDAEHKGDEHTHNIFRRVNSTFITPFDREDIYRLASMLDNVMDEMEGAVDLMFLYRIETLPSDLALQVDVLQRAAVLTAEAMPKLRSPGQLEEYWIEINRLENEGDQIYRRLLAHLFSGEYDALTVLKLKGVVDALELAADNFEHVANAVEQIALKES
jgi:predicted phosphate transport protein (TIGR00153 family)